MKQFFIFLFVMLFSMYLNQSVFALGYDEKADVTARAVRGDADAQCYLAWSYRYGENGFEKNFDLAEKWFLRAVEQHDFDAMNGLASLYEAAAKTSAQPKKDELNQLAFGLYNRSAHEGRSVQGMYHLGTAYYEGMGVKKNIERAVECFNEVVAAPQNRNESKIDYARWAKGKLVEIENNIKELKPANYVPQIEE